MVKALTQLTLGVSLLDEATFINFYPGKNTQIIDALKRTVTGEGERLIYLCGTVSQGCSHLLQACCHFAHQQHVSSIYLPLGNLKYLSPDALKGFENLDLICIDDLDVIAGQKAWEEAIFHLYNRVNDAGGRLIIAAHALPKSLGLTLADLISRLAWGIIYQLSPLSDIEKLFVLQARAESRGIKVTDEVGKFILNHYPRHMSVLFAALDKLDQASLAAHRRLTIPFVKEVLQL